MIKRIVRSGLLDRRALTIDALGLMKRIVYQQPRGGTLIPWLFPARRLKTKQPASDKRQFSKPYTSETPREKSYLADVTVRYMNVTSCARVSKLSKSQASRNRFRTRSIRAASSKPRETRDNLPGTCRLLLLCLRILRRGIEILTDGL